MVKIEEKVEELMDEFLNMNPLEESFKPGAFKYRERQLIQGMRFNRDRAQNERIKQGQMLRMIGMIAKDPELRKQYIQATQPGALPDLRSRPKK